MAATPAIAALERAGIAFLLHPYRPDPSHSSYGLAAAAALAVEPRRVLKTLVVSTDRGLAVCVVEVGAELDWKATGTALGTKRVELAEPSLAERSSGYVVGGISPLGQRRALPTVIDDDAKRWPSVYVSAGRRGLELELAPADLARATDATFAAIARRRPGTDGSAPDRAGGPEEDGGADQEG